MAYDPYEPLPDHLADTGPVQAVRAPERDTHPVARLFGCLSLIGAAALTVGAAVILLMPDASTPTPDAPVVVIKPTEADAAKATLAPALPTAESGVNSAVGGEAVAQFTVLPTLDPAQVGAYLSEPPAPASVASDGIAIVRAFYNPFTIIPDRPRNEVEQYTIVSGDTIFTIAERFALQPETIVWGNDNSLVHGLRPGNQINILPVDGVYHQVLGGETIAEVAGEYNVDPYLIIDSDYNNIFGARPEDQLPSGTRLVIPGAQREQISWNPVVERTGGSGGSGGSGGTIAFAPGDPGSCGAVPNPGGGSYWSPPLGNYTYMRGFSSVHSGVDLSSPPGTPVFAANTGTVIFAGWNTWGYGYTVVLAHGPFTSLYAHMSSISVGCGQLVSSGGMVGAVGSSGNSTGPHLHFEIRYNDVPQDPTYTLPF